MSLTARDLLPLVSKLSHDEQVRLARLVLAAAAEMPQGDAATYRTLSPKEGEFSLEDDHLSWEGGGWEEFGGAG